MKLIIKQLLYQSVCILYFVSINIIVCDAFFSFGNMIQLNNVVISKEAGHQTNHLNLYYILIMCNAPIDLSLYLKYHSG